MTAGEKLRILLAAARRVVAKRPLCYDELGPACGCCAYCGAAGDGSERHVAECPWWQLESVVLDFQDEESQ